MKCLESNEESKPSHSEDHNRAKRREISILVSHEFSQNKPIVLVLTSKLNERDLELRREKKSRAHRL